MNRDVAYPAYAWAEREVGARVFCVLIGVDVLANAILTLAAGGAPYTTISCRIGMSLAAGGWASPLPWPAWFRAHCLGAVYQATV